MAIINRALDVSEQRKTFDAKAGATANGVTGILCTVPWASVLDGAQVAAFGLSGAPTVTLKVNRFIIGAGVTAFAVSGAEAVAAFGTSGVLARGMSLLASGNTLLNLLPNDVIMWEAGGGTGAAATGYSVSIVLRPLQDIKTHFKLSSGI